MTTLCKDINTLGEVDSRNEQRYRAMEYLMINALIHALALPVLILALIALVPAPAILISGPFAAKALDETI